MTGNLRMTNQTNNSTKAVPSASSAVPVTPPTPKQFYVEYPLYEEFTFNESQSRDGWRIKYFGGTIDTFCPECGSHSIFTHSPRNVQHEVDSWEFNHLFDVTLICSRKKEHQLYFLFQVRGRTIQKIGQFPSLATLNLYDVRQYTSVLSKDSFREFTKAIGLAAHGVGVGSFVYLRRIFEGLIEEAHKQALLTPGWDEGEFAKGRMSEKIQSLTAYLPKFLVEHRSLYGILSKGVHELTEDECLKAFPVVKLGIEIVLDAKLREQQERNKLEEASRAIQHLSGQHGT